MKIMDYLFKYFIIMIALLKKNDKNNSIRKVLTSIIKGIKININLNKKTLDKIYIGSGFQYK
jgi:hypothetical protein